MRVAAFGEPDVIDVVALEMESEGPSLNGQWLGANSRMYTMKSGRSGGRMRSASGLRRLVLKMAITLGRATASGTCPLERTCGSSHRHRVKRGDPA